MIIALLYSCHIHTVYMTCSGLYTLGIICDLFNYCVIKQVTSTSSEPEDTGEELITLGKRKRLKSYRSIVKLDPFIDDEGILRVRGRIHRWALANEMQRPALLTKSCRIAELIVRWYHEQVAHAGWGMAMNQTRSSGFWVTRCKSLV